MKICVFSDSHGWAENMIEAVWREHPTLCFFLGASCVFCFFISLTSQYQSVENKFSTDWFSDFAYNAVRYRAAKSARCQIHRTCR